MAKPLILARPSGAFVRLRIPNDLRGRFGGRRFVVRRIYDHDQAEIRLAAAVLALVFSRAFAAIRRGESVDWDRLIAGALARGEVGKTSDFKLRITQHGPEIETDGTAEDNAAANKALMAYWDAQAGRGANRGVKQVLFATAKDKYLADLERGVELHQYADKTYDESWQTLNVFEALLPEGTYLDAITDDHVRDFYTLVGDLPPNARKRKPYKQHMPEHGRWDVQEVVALRKANGDKAIAAWTQEKHRSRLAAFLNFQVKAKALRANPMDGVASNSKPDAEDTGRPFTAEEMAAIFEADRFWDWGKKHPHQFFGPMLGLYSGARVNEIGQLYVDDIAQYPGTEVWGFHVRHNPARGQRTKNKQSRRFVPIAPAVLDAGLLTYIHDLRSVGHTRLFPELPNATGRGFGRTLSKHFAMYLREECGIAEKGSGFHYFRHSLISDLYNHEVNPKVIGEITGHLGETSTGAQSVMTQFYVKVVLPSVLKAMEAYQPPVKVPTYVRGMFSRDLRTADKEWKPVPRQRKKKTTPR